MLDTIFPIVVVVVVYSDAVVVANDVKFVISETETATTTATTTMVTKKVNPQTNIIHQFLSVKMKMKIKNPS